MKLQRMQEKRIWVQLSSTIYRGPEEEMQLVTTGSLISTLATRIIHIKSRSTYFLSLKSNFLINSILGYQKIWSYSTEKEPKCWILTRWKRSCSPWREDFRIIILDHRYLSHAMPSMMEEYEQRQRFLSIFHEMANSGFKIFLTSPPYPVDVRDSYSTAIQLDITPQNQDLELHVANLLNSSSKFCKVVHSNSMDLKDILPTIVSSAEGIWVAPLIHSRQMLFEINMFNYYEIGFFLRIWILFLSSNNPQHLTFQKSSNRSEIVYRHTKTSLTSFMIALFSISTKGAPVN